MKYIWVCNICGSQGKKPLSYHKANRGGRIHNCNKGHKHSDFILLREDGRSYEIEERKKVVVISV